MSDPKEVVVVGGGYLGNAVANELAKVAPKANINITIIDKREGAIHKVAALRTAVNKSWQKVVFIPRNNLSKKVQVINEWASSINDKEVTLENGDIIPFDYLICATGSTSISPGEPPLELTTEEQIDQYYDKVSSLIKQSNNISLIGGGVVGVELAGEIKEKYPEKEVTIVHKGEQLLSNMQMKLKPKALKIVTKKLEKLGVKIKLGTTAVVDREVFKSSPFLEGVSEVKLDNGESIETDLIISCVGTELNNKMYPKEWLNEKGEVKITETLQLENLPNAFALGDICSYEEDKMLAHSGKHIPVVVQNLLALVRGKGKMPKTYTGSPDAIIIPIGKGGLSALPIGTFADFATRQIKGKNLFTPLVFSWAGEKAEAVWKKKYAKEDN